MKWFSLSAISKEIGKIRWPKKKDLAENSVQVILFTVAFGFFFFLCQILISLVLKAMGVVA